MQKTKIEEGYSEFWNTRADMVFAVNSNKMPMCFLLSGMHGLHFEFFESGLFVRLTWSEVKFSWLLPEPNLLNLDSLFTEDTLLVVCLTYIHRESNRSPIACVMLLPDPKRIKIENLQNRNGSTLKNIRVRALLLFFIMWTVLSIQC